MKALTLPLKFMTVVPDVYREEFSDFKHKQNELPSSSGILCRVA